jgi:hypothetical protein
MSTLLDIVCSVLLLYVAYNSFDEAFTNVDTSVSLVIIFMLIVAIWT